MRRTVLLVIVGFVGAALLGGCAPSTFVETMEPTWASVEVKDDMVGDKSWEAITDILVRRFDLEMVAKDAGYIRTGWLYTWTGEMTPKYRVRATLKFVNKGKKVDIKSEAHYGGTGRWVIGTDTSLLKTLKTDIMGAVSRTTR